MLILTNDWVPQSVWYQIKLKFRTSCSGMCCNSKVWTRKDCKTPFIITGLNVHGGLKVLTIDRGWVILSILLLFGKPKKNAFAWPLFEILQNLTEIQLFKENTMSHNFGSILFAYRTNMLGKFIANAMSPTFLGQILWIHWTSFTGSQFNINFIHIQPSCSNL